MSVKAITRLRQPPITICSKTKTHPSIFGNE